MNWHWCKWRVHADARPANQSVSHADSIAAHVVAGCRSRPAGKQPARAGIASTV